MEKNKSTEEIMAEFKAEFAKLNLAEQAFVRALAAGTGQDEAVAALMEAHGELESVMSEDWG